MNSWRQKRSLSGSGESAWIYSWVSQDSLKVNALCLPSVLCTERSKTTPLTPNLRLSLHPLSMQTWVWDVCCEFISSTWRRIFNGDTVSIGAWVLPRVSVTLIICGLYVDTTVFGQHSCYRRQGSITFIPLPNCPWVGRISIRSWRNEASTNFFSIHR